MSFPFPFSYWASQISGFSPSANFGAGFNGPIFAVAQQSDGKILIGGNFTTYKGSTVATGLVRLNLNGTLDTTFNTALGTGFVASTVGTGIKRNVASIKVWSDGSIYVGGDFTSLNGTAVSQIIKLDTNGNLDGTFAVSAIGTSSGATGYSAVTILTIEEGLQNDLVIGGMFTSIAGFSPQPQYVASLNPTTGAQSNTLPIVARSTDNDIAVYKVKRISGNRLMIAGGFDNVDSNPGTYKAAFIVQTSGANYAIDTSFAWAAAPTTNNARSVFDFIEKPDGKFLFVGSFSTTSPACIRAASSTGGNDATFVGGTGFSAGNTSNGYIRTRAMTLFESGSFVYVGGTFTQYKGTNIDAGICRIDKATGTIDTTFNPSAGVAGGFVANLGPLVSQIGPVLSNTSGSFFIYGDFTSYDGATTGSIAQPSVTGSRYLVS